MSTEVGSLKATLTIDIRPFTSGINSAMELTKSLGNALKSALGDSSQGFSSILRETARLKSEIDTLRAAVTSLNAEFGRTRIPEGFAQVQQHTSRMKDDLAKATGAASQLAGASKGAETAMSGVGGKAQVVSEYVDVATGEVLKLLPLTQAVGANFNQATTAAKGVGAAAGNAADAAKKIDVNVDKAEKETKELAEAFKTVSEESAKAAKSTESAKTRATQLNNTSNAIQRSANESERMAKGFKNAYSFARDLKRIVAGIVISQGFYQALNIMNELVNGSMKFANNMDQANIAFKYLLGNQKDAVGMINILQDFAIHSPLDSTAVMDATRKLLAMGFSAKSVVPTLQILADTSAVFTSEAGDMSEMISHITLAIGQMKSSGKVMTQELRQLYNAGVPVFKILQEELGLTAAEVRNIGKLGIDSSVAVTALLNGLRKRYAGAADEFTKTIPGAMEVIKDSIYVIYSILAVQPRNAFKEWINEIASSIEALVVISRAYGPGGFINAFFPPELHYAIRAIMGSMMQLGSAFAIAGQVIRDLFGNAISYLTQLLGYILPPISILINFILQLIRALYVSVPFVRQLAAAFVALLVVRAVVIAFLWLWKVLRFGKLLSWIKVVALEAATGIKWLAGQIIAAAGANLVFVASLLAVIALLTLFMLNSERVRASVGKIVDAFKNMDLGFDPMEIAPPEYKPPEVPDFAGGTIADILPDDFADGLDDVNDKLGDTSKNADKAKKKLKEAFNQSFDEVFLIDPKDDLSDSLDDLDKLKALKDLPKQMDFSNVLADIGDITGALGNLAMTGDFDTDWANVQDAFKLDGLDFGEEITLAGQEFWKAITEAFSAPEWVAAGIGGGIGALIGGLLFGPAGAIIGGLIGASAGLLAGLYWDEIKAALKSVGLTEQTAILGAIGVPLAAALGYMVGGPTGALFMGGITAWAAWLIGEVEEGLRTGNWSGVGAPIGIGIGAAMGFAIGGPGGAAIGAGVGWLVGSLSDLLFKGFETGDFDWPGIGMLIGGGLGGAIGFAVGGPGGAVIGLAIGSLLGWITGQLGELDWGAIGAQFSAGLGTLGTSITTWLTDTSIQFSNWALEMWVKFTTWLNDLWIGLTTWLGTLWTDLTTWFDDISVRFGDWLLGLWNGLMAWFSDIWTKFTTWLADLWTKITTWFNDIWTKLTTWLSDIWTKVTTWFSDIWTKFTTWLGDVWTKLTTWFSDIWTKLTTWISDISTSFSTFMSDLWTTISNGVGSIYDKFKSWVDDLWNNIFGKFFGWIASGIDKLKEFFGLNRKAQGVEIPNVSTSNPMSGMAEHATGGIFDREHIARFAEGNKPEAIIPLDNASAMQPFVDSVANGLISSLAPLLATRQSTQEQLPPVYVGTLIADERGLRELERKMRIVRIKEESRGG